MIDRLRGRGQITLDEWSCMADVIKDVNWQVGMRCHNGKVPFSEFAQHQEAGHRACIAEGRRNHARCAVIQVDWRRGRAGFCD